MTSTAPAFPSDDRVKEPELIAQVLAGDRAAARALYDAHAPRVFRLAYRLTGDGDLARELTQDTFVRAFAQLARFRGDAAFSTWLHRITISVTSNAMRKITRMHTREVELDDTLPTTTEPAAVDPILRDRLARAIDALPEIYRITVIMHDMEGYTHTEIGEILGIAEGTCKSRLSIARAQLRAALHDLAGEVNT